LATIVEISEKSLRPKDGSELRSDAVEVEQHRRRRCRNDSLRVEQRVPLAFHSLDLLEQQFKPVKFTADLDL